MTTSPSEERTPERLLDDLIEPFLKQLHDAGYAERTLRKKRTVTRAFARWVKRKRIAIVDLNDNHVVAFVARWPRRRKAHVKFEHAVLRLFFRYLRAGARIPSPLPQERTSAAGDLLRRYEEYLRKERGLAENSVHVYVPFIRDFLASQFAPTDCIAPQAFEALAIRDFILGQTPHRSAEYIRLLATALRSFLRFLFLSGQIPRDLAPSVPRVCKYRNSAPPAFLSPEEVTRVLAAPDRSTSTGRRDYAILLLLARLGLRAGEIVSLELDDLRWRNAEIVIRGKGRIVDQLPLLRDVGAALAAYLREDRGVSASRRVFLRIWAPHIGLTGPAAVGHIVRSALAQAGIRRSGRGAAHLFRHGLGTKMIRRGASLRRNLRGPPASLSDDHFDLHPGGLRVFTYCGSTLAGYGRCPMINLRDGLTQYVALRRALGTKLQEPAITLGRFLDFLEGEKAEFITSELALRWAIQPQGVQRATWARRLGMVRGFAAWFSTIDDRTEVPPRRLLAARRRRNKPHIFTEQEILQLMA